MGLDNILYTRQPVQDKKLSSALENLCGGSFMTDHNNSFRGKVYDNIHEAISGYSLYNSDEYDYGDYESIVQSYKSVIENDLKGFLKDYNSEENAWGWEYKKEEVKALYRVFELCLEEDWRINAWY